MTAAAGGSRKPPEQRLPDVDLGLKGESVPEGAHVAYFWETDEEFTEAVNFLRVGIEQGDHCVVFGHGEANERVLELLHAGGADVEALRGEGRLSVLGGRESGEEILAEIGATFQSAMDAGAGMIRLLGNVGWGRAGWPDQGDLLRFEARVTAAAAAFPCVVVCLYDVRSLGGQVVLHGAFECHPLTICGNLVRENPHYRDFDEFLRSVEEIERVS